MVTNDDGSFRFVGILSKNREEWSLTDLACIVSGIVGVTLFDTLPAENIAYILNQTQMRALALPAEKLPIVLKLAKEGQVPDLHTLLYFD